MWALCCAVTREMSWMEGWAVHHSGQEEEGQPGAAGTGQMAPRSLGGDMSSKESQQPNHGLPLPLGNVVEVGRAGFRPSVGCADKRLL